jgi:3-deoxy-7-phosphoheptulonate synthase
MSDFATRRTWGPKPNYPAVRSVLPARPFTRPFVIAGPCSIESTGQIEAVAMELARLGVNYMRGGVYRAGTYPPADFGLKRDLLAKFKRVAAAMDLKTIIEVLDVRQIEELDPFADAFQVGARHMQDYALLRELSKLDKIVTIKRNMGATLDEFLGAAEYLANGRCFPILIERGGSTNLNHVRWDLSFSLVAAIKRVTGIPIIVDASHGTGRRDLVEPMTLAGLAAGADGFLVEVHPDPVNSLSDADQAYPLSRFGILLDRARHIYSAISSFET